MQSSESFLIQVNEKSSQDSKGKRLMKSNPKSWIYRLEMKQLQRLDCKIK